MQLTAFVSEIFLSVIMASHSVPVATLPTSALAWSLIARCLRCNFSISNRRPRRDIAVAQDERIHSTMLHKSTTKLEIEFAPMLASKTWSRL